jgi:Metallo-peptidase family M12
MKKFSLFLCFWLVTSLISKSQTVIKFFPDKALKNIQNATSGSMKQTGSEFIGKLDVELPDKILNLNLKASSIKQYTYIITPDGNIPSTVEVYEDFRQQEKYIVTTIDRQFYSLLMLEQGKNYRLEKIKNEKFVYESIDTIENPFAVQLNDFVHSPQTNKNTRQVAVSGCFDFPVGFVCDYAYYQGFQLQHGKGVAEIEADNLMKLAFAQSVFGAYAFDAQISFKVIGQVIYDKSPDDSPWRNTANDNLINVWADFNNYWQKPKDWEKHKLLIKVGITGINFGATATDKYTWGIGSYLGNEYTMGCLIFKGLLSKNEINWIFSHELGHVFGANHDQVASQMSPLYNGSSTWSSKSKTEINASLSTLNDKKFLQSCPQILFNWEVLNDSLVLEWQTNYDSINDYFTVEYKTKTDDKWEIVTELKALGIYKYKISIPNRREYLLGATFRIRQRGVNEINSNNVSVIITSTQETLPPLNTVVFLNTSNNHLVINSPKPTNVYIYEMNGILKTKLELPNRENTFDVSSWKAGSYIVQVESNPPIIFKITKFN